MNIQTITSPPGKPADNSSNTPLNPDGTQPAIDFSQLLITELEPVTVSVPQRLDIEPGTDVDGNSLPSDEEITGTLWQMFAVSPTSQAEKGKKSSIDLMDISAPVVNSARNVTYNTQRNISESILPVRMQESDSTLSQMSMQLPTTPEAAKQIVDLQPSLKQVLSISSEMLQTDTDSFPSLHHLVNTATDNDMLTLSVDSQSGPVKDGVLNTSAKNAIEQGLQTRINWMIQNQVKSAEIRMDPPELGSLDIQVNVNKEHTTVTITTANSQVRDAIESGVFRLKELLENNGLQLGSFDIRQQNSNTQDNSFSSDQQAANVLEPEHETETAVQAGKSYVYKVGLLDAYA